MNNTADIYTKTSFDARNLLLLCYGEEYAITLPSLDSLSNVAIAFKNGATTTANHTYRLYPNPAGGTVQYNATRLLPTDKVSISLYTPQGQCAIQHTTIGGTIVSINTDSLLPGIYYYHILLNGQVVLTDKLVILK